MHLVIIFNKEMDGFGRTGGRCSHEASLSGKESGGGGLHMGIRMGGSAGVCPSHGLSPMQAHVSIKHSQVVPRSQGYT